MLRYDEVDIVMSMLPDELQNVLQWVHQETKAPKLLILSEMLSVMSIAAQHVVDISPKARLCYPASLFFTIIAESGERKSTVDRYLMRPIYEFEKEQVSLFNEEMHRFNATLKLWELKKKKLTHTLECLMAKGEDSTHIEQDWQHHELAKPAEPVCRRILVNDISSAALKSLLQGIKPSLALVSDEAGALLSKELLQNCALFCSLWSGQTVSIDRVNRMGGMIEDARLSMSMMVQPGMFGRFFERHADVMESSGLFARILFCQPRSEIGKRMELSLLSVFGLPADIGQMSLDNFHATTRQRLLAGYENNNLGKARHCLTFDERAQEMWSQKYNQLEMAMGEGQWLETYRDIGSKFMEQVTRLAAVLHVYTRYDYLTENVNASTLHTAIKLAEIYLHQAIGIFNREGRISVDSCKDAEVLLQWLLQNGKRGSFKRSEIRRCGPYSLRNKDVLNRAIDILIHEGHIKCFKKKQSITIFLSNKHSLLQDGMMNIPMYIFGEGKYGEPYEGSDLTMIYARKSALQTHVGSLSLGTLTSSTGFTLGGNDFFNGGLGN